MIKPDDIPQDVWDAARKPAKIACAPYNTPEIARAIVARAIMAETRACAKIADSYIDPIDIAHHIRKRGVPK